jgi:hypothetical protein
MLALAVAAVASGCGGSSSTAPTPITAVQLVGTYDLLSITFQGQPTLTPPAATGVLVLTPTTYAVTLHVAPATAAEVDSGTYSISGNQWSQTSTTSQVQSVGTFTFSHDTLTVNVTTQGMQVNNVWKKRT